MSFHILPISWAILFPYDMTDHDWKEFEGRHGDLFLKDRMASCADPQDFPAGSCNVIRRCPRFTSRCSPKHLRYFCYWLLLLLAFITCLEQDNVWNIYFCPWSFVLTTAGTRLTHKKAVGARISSQGTGISRIGSAVIPSLMPVSKYNSDCLQSRYSK